MGRHIPSRRRSIRIPGWAINYAYRGAKAVAKTGVLGATAERSLNSYDEFKRTEAIAKRMKAARVASRERNQREIFEFYNRRRKVKPVAAIEPLSPGARRTRKPVAPSSYGGRFKRRRKSKKVRKPTQGNTDSVYGRIMGHHAAYGGWSTCGGRDHALLQFSEQLLRQMLYERKLDIPGRTEALPFTTTTADSVKLLYRTVNVDGSHTNAHEVITITTGGTTKTFSVVANAIKTSLSTSMALNTRYLYGYELTCNGEVMVARHQVDTWKLSMRVRVNFKVQNVTPADDVAGTDDNKTMYSKDSILSNPLQGRSYQFSPGYPRVRPKIAEAQALATLADEASI